MNKRTCLQASSLLVGSYLALACSECPARLSDEGEACDEHADCSGGAACIASRCERWYGVGGSDFGPRSVWLTWDSASGGGISNDAAFSEASSLALDSAGRPVVAWHGDLRSEPGTNYTISVARFDGAAWRQVGTSGPSRDPSAPFPLAMFPSLAIDSADRPVVAWSDGPGRIYVARFDGEAWRPVGASGTSGAGIYDVQGNWSSRPSLALDGAGRPIIAWNAGPYWYDEIYVAQYEDGLWQPVGPTRSATGSISRDAEPSIGPALAIDASGRPLVVWQDSMLDDGRIHVSRFDGNAWRDLGALDSSINDVFYDEDIAALAVDATGSPVVAWLRRSSAGADIHVARHDGSTWQAVGMSDGSPGGISNTGGASKPSLALDAAGNPVVAWEDASSGNEEIYVARFDGRSWLPVGVSGASGGGISNTPEGSTLPSLALDASGNPTVAWQEHVEGGSEIYVMSFDGSAWQPVGASGGGASDNAGYSMRPSLALDRSGRAVVAWADASSEGNVEIYVARFDGQVWQSVGVSSNADGGISNNLGRSWAPSLALDASDRPIVAWYDATSGINQIYALHFDGSAWQPIGLSSASQGGVSNSSAPSRNPSLALRKTTACIAWEEVANGATEIVLRCARL